MPIQKTIIPFINKANTSITYSSTLRAMYGPVPKVEVWYWTGTQYEINNFVDLRMEVSSTGYEGPHHPGAPPAPPPEVKKIKVDHGGISTGIVKIG